LEETVTPTLGYRYTPINLHDVIYRKTAVFGVSVARTPKRKSEI